MQKLFDLFDEIGLPYFRQGSLSDEDYQPSFFTFWNIDTPETKFYDNEAHGYIEYIQVGFYTNNAELVYSQLDKDGKFYNKAKEKKFVFDGGAKDAPSDKKGYFGRILYIKIIHEGE